MGFIETAKLWAKKITLFLLVQKLEELLTQPNVLEGTLVVHCEGGRLLLLDAAHLHAQM